MKARAEICADYLTRCDERDARSKQRATDADAETAVREAEFRGENELFRQEVLNIYRPVKTNLKNLIIEVARLWPGHSGVNFGTTTRENLLLLIRDAVEDDRAELLNLRITPGRKLVLILGFLIVGFAIFMLGYSIGKGLF